MSSSRRRRGRNRVDRSPSPEIDNDDDGHGANNFNDDDNGNGHSADNASQSDNVSQNDDPNEEEMSQSNNHTQNGTNNSANNPPIDNDTLRILISTDNHLGYAESDPIRSNDSFAAFEEILYLAKYKYSVDLILLSGDLFHHNKPSRSTLYKTFLLLRKYTLGDNPVSIQIVSDQYENFISTVHPWNVVNYEYPFMSIDLPIFSIHGNHDDPTRDNTGTSTKHVVEMDSNNDNNDQTGQHNGHAKNAARSKSNGGVNDGSTEKTKRNNNGDMLAALDLLAINNLVNYFGRQDEIDKISINPILLQKGDYTKVAIYGMGNMRDERLNRMWQGNKVRFMKPDNKGTGNGSGHQDNDNDENNSSEEEDDEENEWFNIFALHQNRDLGRGSKNCIHESMIPGKINIIFHFGFHFLISHFFLSIKLIHLYFRMDGFSHLGS